MPAAEDMLLPRSVPATARFLDDSEIELRAPTSSAAEQFIADIEDAVGTLPPQLRSSLRVALRTTGLRRVSVLADAVGITTRALSRACTRAHLPAPKHWLLLAHAIHLSEALARNPAARFSDLAELLGYPDEFSLSRALYSTLGCRLRTLRRNQNASFVIARWVIRHSVTTGPRWDPQPA
jgi:AraC-like DNA-binding protein